MTKKTFESRATALLGFPVTIAVHDYFRSAGFVSVNVYLPEPSTGALRTDGRGAVRISDALGSVVRKQPSVAKVLDLAFENFAARVAAGDYSVPRTTSERIARAMVGAA